MSSNSLPMDDTRPQNDPLPKIWSRSVSEVMDEMHTSMTGVSDKDAAERLTQFGPNSIGKRRQASAVGTFVRQFRNPLVLILIFAASVSAAIGDSSEAITISLIVLASCLLSFSQEYVASKAMEGLRRQISTKVTVVRNSEEITTPSGEIVPGDIVKLSAGNLISADGLIIEARDFNVSEAALTGETFPVIKSLGVAANETPLARRTNMVFNGTSVRSGTATIVVVATGSQTEFAKIAAALERQVPITDFAKGIGRFGTLMTEIMLAIVIVVFVANLLLQRALFESLLFSLALAVGLTPELLPAIISVTLSHGARSMARNGVIVRRLEAIENLGSMDLLCTDKTGTLTEGIIHHDGSFGADGKPSDSVFLWAKLNATLQTGLANPLDSAISAAPADGITLASYAKVDEIPYDFIRKRLTVIVREKPNATEDLIICKGALSNVLGSCSVTGVPLPRCPSAFDL